jgi:branched-subunit amino acid ABC-type transport system permease component
MDALKILGQLNPAATTLTTLYTVPALTSTTVSSITICNQNNAYIAFNISVAIGGAADSPEQYIYYNLSLDPYDTFIATIGMSLATTDLIRVYATSTQVSFNLFGVELT